MIKFGVIGSGWIAEEFVKGSQLVEGFEFSAMYSRSYDKGKSFADKFADVPVYTDLEELAQSDIDAVYIASPNSLHFEQSKMMLESGKHVLCEKPATITPDEFSQLRKLADEKNLVYTEAIMMLHLPQKNLIKSELKSLGNISTAHFDFSQLSSKYQALKNGENPNIFNPKMFTGCLRDLGIYCFYPAVEFFGLPKKIFASAGFVSTGADGYGTTVLDYEDKQITLTYSKIGQDFCGSQIAGDRGTLTFDSISKLTGVYYKTENVDKKEIVGEIEKHILMSFEAKDFLNYIIDNDKRKSELAPINDTIFEVSKLMYEVKNQCGIY